MIQIVVSISPLELGVADMEGFKSNAKMGNTGHYSHGGAVMKKAKGGVARGEGTDDEESGTLRMEKMPSGAQQYIRGSTRPEKEETAAKYTKYQIKKSNDEGSDDFESFWKNMKKTDKLLDARMDNNDAFTKEIREKYGFKTGGKIIKKATGVATTGDNSGLKQYYSPRGAAVAAIKETTMRPKQGLNKAQQKAFLAESKAFYNRPRPKGPAPSGDGFFDKVGSFMKNNPDKVRKNPRDNGTPLGPDDRPLGMQPRPKPNAGGVMGFPVKPKGGGGAGVGVSGFGPRNPNGPRKPMAGAAGAVMNSMFKGPMARKKGGMALGGTMKAPKKMTLPPGAISGGPHPVSPRPKTNMPLVKNPSIGRPMGKPRGKPGIR
jgi:hypothetical protein